MEPIKQEIITNIFENGDKLITGPILQTVLIDMIDDVNVKDQEILSKTGSWDDAATQIPNLVTKAELTEAKDSLQGNITNLSESVARDLENVDLTGYATEQWVTDKGYATTTALQEVGDLASAIASAYVTADTALSKRIDALKAESDTHAAASVVTALSNKVSSIETAYVAADAALAERVGTLETESTKHASADTVKTHIDNGTIHVTAEDKTKWNGAAAQKDLDAAIARIAALEAKLDDYDKRFGWNKNVATGGEWGVNFLQID